MELNINMWAKVNDRSASKASVRRLRIHKNKYRVATYLILDSGFPTFQPRTGKNLFYIRAIHVPLLCTAIFNIPWLSSLPLQDLPWNSFEQLRDTHSIRFPVNSRVSRSTGGILECRFIFKRASQEISATLIGVPYLSRPRLTRLDLSIRERINDNYLYRDDPLWRMSPLFRLTYH